MSLQVSLCDANGIQALTAMFGPVVFVNIPLLNFNQSMTEWFQSLPTTLPATSGVLWNNGGILSLS